MLLLKVPALSLLLLCPAFVWNSNNPSHVVHAFTGTAVVDHIRRRRRCCFERETTRHGNTELHLHRFNGGYDPASPLTWTPQQAAEFTIFHEGTPQHAGMQLKTTIQHWTGTDVAEFLTRLYLGQLANDNITNNDDGIGIQSTTKKVVYEPKNVRTPQWEGLDTREGVFALKDLLKEALSKEALSAQEVSRFAEAFLLKDYRWPSQIQKSNSDSNSTTSIGASILSNSQAGEVVFEDDSFYSLGHARTIARVLLAVRKERGYDDFTWSDIIVMVTLPEQRDEEREAIPMKMIEFLRTISACIALTATDKANIVRGMAMSGWLSASIPKFMAELLPAETMSEDHSVDPIHAFQGDSFFDFPTAATVSEANAKKEKKNTSAIDIAVAKVAKVVGKKDRSTTSPKQARSSKDIVGSEYEDLVQSYWKKVEVTTTQKKKNPVQGYGVPKTKSIKKRNIPNESESVVESVSIVDSVTKKSIKKRNLPKESIVDSASKSIKKRNIPNTSAVESVSA
jgi:hypothetical protein